MRCAHCGNDNPVGPKFCVECGIPLMYKCLQCGAENLPQAKFCGGCGAPLLVKISVISKIARETSLRLLEAVTKIGETIKVLLLAILLIVVSAIIIDQIWPRSNRQSITITSFADTSGDKNGGFGLALADKLEFEILRIAQLHALKNP
jgi:uncharacterized membrane protein YvbJ